MKTSLVSLFKSIACTVIAAIATLNVASAQQIRIDLNSQQVEQFIDLIGGNVNRPIRVIQPDFNRPIVNPIIDNDPQPEPVPVVVDAIPQRLQGTWVETTAAETKYHQLKADGTHNLGVVRNGIKSRFAQRASFANGVLQLAGGTYSLTMSQGNTLRLSNSREVRTWVRYDENQPVVNNLSSQLLGVWYEDTREADTLMVNRYEIKADGSYDMQAFDRNPDGTFDLANPVDHLGAVVPASARQYRLTGTTLFLAEGHPHAEGPLELKAEAGKMLVTENGVVRVWKRTP